VFKEIFKKKIMEGTIDQCSTEKCPYNKEQGCNYPGGIVYCDDHTTKEEKPCQKKPNK